MCSVRSVNNDIGFILCGGALLGLAPGEHPVLEGVPKKFSCSHGGAVAESGSLLSSSCHPTRTCNGMYGAPHDVIMLPAGAPPQQDRMVVDILSSMASASSATAVTSNGNISVNIAVSVSTPYFDSETPELRGGEGWGFRSSITAREFSVKSLRRF